MRKRILFIFLLVLCLCAVPVSAAALGKVSGVKAKQSGEKVKVTWNTAAGAKGYQVYQKTGSEKFHRIKTTGKKSYTVRGLTPGNTYYFRVRAYADSSGKKKYGKYSSSVKITIKNSSAAESKVITVSLLIWNTFQISEAESCTLKKEPITCSFLCIFLPIPLLYLRTVSRSNGRTRELFSSFAVTMT